MCDENISKLKYLATQLVEFADEAVEKSRDDRCFLLYGLTKDCGYRILAEADKECRYHAEKRKAAGADTSGTQ